MRFVISGYQYVAWWTHKNDFIMAAKTDEIYGQIKTTRRGRPAVLVIVGLRVVKPLPQDIF